MPNSGSTLFENSYIKMGTVITVLIFLVTLVIHEAEYRTNLSRDLLDIAKEVKKLEETVDRLDKKIVGKTPEGWHRNDMKLWTLEAEKKNKGLQLPDPYKLGPNE